MQLRYHLVARLCDANYRSPITSSKLIQALKALVNLDEFNHSGTQMYGINDVD